MRLLKAQLRKIKQLETRINPDREWVLRNREQLMTQIGHSSKQAVTEYQVSPKVGHTINTWTKIFIPQSLVYSLKPLASVMVALVLTTAGWIASAYAEPGDVLWDAKNAVNSVVENSRLILATDQEQTSLKLGYASKQAHVLQQVVETDRIDGEEKAKLVDKTVENLQKKLDSAQESIKTLAPADAANLVKEVSLSTQDISQTLKETAENATDNGISEKIEKTAVEATKQSLEMVGDTVQKKTDAKLEFSLEEKEIVKDQIDAAVDSMVAGVLKAQNKIIEQSGATTNLIVTGTSTISTGTISTSTISVTSTTTIGEQKKVVDSLKETNLLEAINTTKVLADQVSTMIEKATVQTNNFNTAASSTVVVPIKVVPTTPISSTTTSSTK